MFGLRDLHVAIAVFSWFEPLAGFGAVVAWVMHIDHDAAGKETPVLRHFNIKCIILPRQARGKHKHRENSQKE
jgi:hypothetical protein